MTSTDSHTSALGLNQPAVAAFRVGATLLPDGVKYCIWAPDHEVMQIDISSSDGPPSRTLTTAKDGKGYHTAFDPEGRAGDLYRYCLQDGSYPDPATRFQPQGVHGPSEVIDPYAYHWTDGKWKRPAFRDLVIYELHVGTFTPEGSYQSAIEKLPYLKELGITAIELMPLAEFAGRHNWGYDGVSIYAPDSSYGRPDDLRHLINEAHGQGIAVILDVVYNHFGPDGNYVGKYSKKYLTERHHTPWGAAFNLDGKHSAPVRDFFRNNPLYWMEEFHVDGFRLDATHEIPDDSKPHLLAEITAVVHEHGGYVIAEDSRNEAKVVTPLNEGGLGFDALWADDFHHTARVGQTRESDGYYRDFSGTLEEMCDTLKHGWLYRGQYSAALKKNRGTPCNSLPFEAFLHCISNHDQVGNRAFGDRLSDQVSPEVYRALSLLLCLTPYTPMLFMGQEWAAGTPFMFFSDHHDELGRLVTEGRRKEFADFVSFAELDSEKAIPDPQVLETFQKSKLNWAELKAAPHRGILQLYKDALHLRKMDTAFRPVDRQAWDVEIMGNEYLGLYYKGAEKSYLLVVNLWSDEGSPVVLNHAHGHSDKWRFALSSNDPAYGGSGGFIFEEGSQSICFSMPGAVLLKG